MFFLRCAFFLSIVYSSMSWTNGALPSHGPVGQDLAHHDLGARTSEAVGSITHTVIKRAVAGATDLCAHHAATCLADAARLTSLFAATEPSVRPEPGVARLASRPRRHGRDTKLTSAP